MEAALQSAKEKRQNRNRKESRSFRPVDLEDIIRYISRHKLYSVHQFHAEKNGLNLKSFRNVPVFKVIYYQGDESAKDVEEVASVLIDSFEESGLNPPGDPRSFFLPEGYRSFSSPQNPRIFPFLLGGTSTERWSATALNVYYPSQQGDSTKYVPEGLVLLSPFNCLEKLHDRLVTFLVKSYSILHDSPKEEKASILKQLLRRDVNGDEKRRYSAAVIASTDIPSSPEMKARDPPPLFSLNRRSAEVHLGEALRVSSGNGVRVSSGNGVRVSSGNGVRESSGNGVRESSGNGVRVSSGNGVRVLSGNGAIQGSLGDEVNGSVGDEVNGSVGDAVNGSVGDAVNGSVGDAVKKPVDDTTLSSNTVNTSPTRESSTAHNSHELLPNSSFMLEERERFLNPYQGDHLDHKPPFLPWNPTSLRLFPLSSISDNDPISSFHRHLRSTDTLRSKVPRHGMRFLFKVLSVQHVLLLIRLLLLEKSILCVSTQYSLLTAVMEALKETL